MKKKILLFVLTFVLLGGSMAWGEGASFVVSDESEENAPISAYLFLSNTCGWCKKLKQEGFPAKFRQKYAGRVNFKEYEIHTQEGSRQFNRLTKKHGLSGGVPVMIIGNTVLSGYSAMARADEAVQKESKKARPVKKATKKKEKNLPAVISITMEDEELQGVASAADLAQMQKYLEQVQRENGATLNSLNSAFSQTVCNRAMAIVSTNEQKLKSLAAKSPNFTAFKKSAATVKANQEKQLNELMQKNKKSLR